MSRTRIAFIVGSVIALGGLALTSLIIGGLVRGPSPTLLTAGASLPGVGVHEVVSRPSPSADPPATRPSSITSSGSTSSGGTSSATTRSGQAH